MRFEHIWNFPLPRTHTGVLQGNGAVGVMIWGGGNVLRVTLNRSDFWDHRGGMPWVEGMSYARIGELLANGDADGLRELFEGEEAVPGQPQRPSLLPLGRIEVVLDPETVLTTARLDMRTGQVIVQTETRERRQEITLDLSMEEPVLHITFPASMPTPEVRCVTAWEFVGDYLRSISFDEPTLFQTEGLSGWVQPRPADPPLCVGYRLQGPSMWLSLECGCDDAAARAAVAGLVDHAISVGAQSFREANRAW